MIKLLLLLSLFYSQNLLAKDLKIVSTSPALTEIVFSVGGKENLKGVSSYCNFPLEARQIKKIGTSFELDYEELMKINPDYVLLTKLKNSKVIPKLKKLMIDYIELNQTSLADIKNSINVISTILSKKNEGDLVIRKIEKELRESNKNNGKKVLIIVGHNKIHNGFNNIYIMGKGTFYQSILKSVGVKNSSQAESKRMLINNEELFRLDPDYIIDILSPTGLTKKEVREVWENKYKNLKAVRNNKIIIFKNDYSLIPGPRIIQIAKDFKKALEM